MKEADKLKERSRDNIPAASKSRFGGNQTEK